MSPFESEIVDLLGEPDLTLSDAERRYPVPFTYGMM